MADGADIALPDSGVPVELDRIYAALRDLTSALGPNGVNADGTLDRTLRAAGAKALDGNGARGNQMLRNLSEAATTFGEGSGDLFETVEQLAIFTDTLARNDELVRAFVADLAGGLASSLVDRARASSRRRSARSPTPSARSRASSRTTAGPWSPTSRSSPG